MARRFGHSKIRCAKLYQVSQALIIVVTDNNGTYCCDCPDLCGSLGVGYGSSAREAIGDWVYHNATLLKITEFKLPKAEIARLNKANKGR